MMRMVAFSPDCMRWPSASLPPFFGAPSVRQVEERIDRPIVQNRQIHDHERFRPNPATNGVNPRAEAFLAAGPGGRPSRTVFWRQVRGRGRRPPQCAYCPRGWRQGGV